MECGSSSTSSLPSANPCASSGCRGNEQTTHPAQRRFRRRICGTFYVMPLVVVAGPFEVRKPGAMVIEGGSILRESTISVGLPPALLAVAAAQTTAAQRTAWSRLAQTSPIIRCSSARVPQDQGTIVHLDLWKKNEQCDGGTRTALNQRGGKLSGSWDDAGGGASLGSPESATHSQITHERGASW
jgi:hypothetical protein